MLLVHSCSLFGTQKNPQNFIYEQVVRLPTWLIVPKKDFLSVPAKMVDRYYKLLLSF